MSLTPFLDECTANYKARLAREEQEDAEQKRVYDSLMAANIRIQELEQQNENLWKAVASLQQAYAQERLKRLLPDRPDLHTP
jgi:TnpA family transposase